MDLSQLAALLQDLGDNTELTERIKSVINQSEATDLLQHFHLDAVISGECTTHIEYKVAQGLVPRKIETRWYRREEPIGRGSYGKVWLEREGKASNQRAVKVMEKDLMTRHGIDFKKEILALAKFSKPQYQQQEVLVKFLGWCEQPSNLFLYMEYFELGDLECHITTSITEDDIKDISTNLLNGLRIMHHEGFAHRDLKPGNIFVVQKPPAARWWVKIGDFGISKRVNHELTALYTSIGTPLYMAPEITGDLDTDEPTSKYNNAVDMWSLGCVVYKVVTQVVPFPARRDLRRFCIGGPFPEQPLLDRITADGTEFVKSLLVPDPRDRLSAESALQTSWLSQRRRQSEDSIQTRARTSPDPNKPAGSTADNGTDPSEATARISTSLLAAQPENPGNGEPRESRRSSAYQIKQHLATSINGMPRPPTENPPLPNHVLDIVDCDSDPAEATIRISAPGSRRPVEPSQPQSPRSPQPDDRVDLVQKAVTETLLATKQLLNKLTEWSEKKASEDDISEAFVRCGYNFNMACHGLESVGIKTADIASFTPSLRTVLETTLSQDASPQALDLYLPRIRTIIIDMLQRMKQKRELLNKGAQKVPAGTREPPVTTAESSHPVSAAQATTTKTPEDYLKRPRDDREVDQLFLQLIEKRGWNKLPAQAKRQMLAYTAAKKWTLVHQDRLTELQGKNKKS
jgi:serine/threonine protein kinase